MSTADPMIHSLADVADCSIGRGTRIWQYVVVMKGAVIGDEVNICAHCLIEPEARIGNRVTIKPGVQVWNGVTLEDDVFVGPNVCFTNDLYPRSKDHSKPVEKTVIEQGASIGAGAILLPGIRIGQHAMIGSGAVVTSSVPPHAIVTGNPARIVGYDTGELGSSATMNPLPVAQQNLETEVESVGVGGVTIHPLKLVHDLRGNLSVGEFESDVPFEVKRYFIVYDVPSEKTRGAHAHHECKQFLICIRGSCSVVIDDGLKRAEVELNDPGKGLYLPPMTWGIQYKYSSDAMLLVFASHHYDPDDYIRDYDAFLEKLNSQAQ